MAYITEIVTIILIIVIWISLSFEFDIDLMKINSTERSPKHKLRFKFNIMKRDFLHFRSVITPEQLMKATKYVLASYIAYLFLPSIERI